MTSHEPTRPLHTPRAHTSKAGGGSGRGQWPRRLLILGAGAVIAGGLIWWRVGRDAGPAATSLPPFTLETPGLRAGPDAGAGDPLLYLLVGGKVDLVLRPNTATDLGAVVARAFWVAQARTEDRTEDRTKARTEDRTEARTEPWALASAADHGVIDLSGTVSSPFAGSLAAELAITVARADDKAPATPDACHAPACLLFRRRVRFVQPLVPGAAAIRAADAEK